MNGKSVMTFNVSQLTMHLTFAKEFYLFSINSKQTFLVNTLDLMNFIGNALRMLATSEHRNVFHLLMTISGKFKLQSMPSKYQ